MKYLNKVLDINAYSIVDEYAYLFCRDGLLKKYDTQVLWKCLTNTQYFVLNLSNELICTYWQFKKIVLINKKTGEIYLEKDLDFKPLKILDGQIFGVNLSKKDGNNVFAVSLLKEDLSEVIKFTTGNFAPINISAEFCVCQFGYNEIAVFNITDGTELWRKEFPANIHKVEVWNETVVLVATHENYITTIFALKAETGEVIWAKPNMSLGLQMQGNFVYSFTTFAFSCINVANGNIEYSYNLMEKFKENNFDEVTNMTVSGEYVYFSGIHDTVISMWELATGNLVWHYRLYPKETVGRGTGKMFIAAGEAPKVIGNRLYQLDGSNTLHIFEREL